MTKLVNTRIQHLVFKIAGQKPTMPAQGIRPDNPAWRPSDIMVGELAYNQTDDAWYYNNGHKIEPFTGILPPTVLTVENVQVFNPTKDPDEDGFAYLAGNTFVSFINEESANPQFQNEAIYRCALNSLPGESPESHPDKWVFQGPTVEISVGNLASIFYIGLDAIKNITGYRNANTAINILTGRIYTYSETSGVGLQPHDNTGTYGRWVSGKRINFSNVAGVVAEHQNGEAFYLPIGHHIIITFGPGNIDIEDDVGDTEVTLQFEGPCFLSRIGSGVAEEDFVVVPIGTGGGGLTTLTQDTMLIGDANNVPEEKTAAQVNTHLGTDASIAHVDEVDEEKHKTNQIIEAAAHELLSLPINSKLSVVIPAIIDYLGTVLTVEGIDLSGIEIGESVLPRVTKQNDGTGLIDTASELLDKHVASSISTLLTENANWGNISGKSSDWIRLLGNNDEGQLGDVAQEYVNDEGVFFECRGSFLETSANGGYADWVRNRNRDVLKSEITLEGAIITAVLATSFNIDGRASVSSPRCKLGDWFIEHPSGFKYSCYLEEDTNSDGQADLWWWYRDALPASDTMQVFDIGNYQNLVTALEAHDFSTGAYDPSVLSGSDEKGEQGQYYYNATTRVLFKCLYDGSKNVWEKYTIVI